MRRYSDHYHLYTGDLNAHIDTETGEHIAHAEKIPLQKGDPSHTPSVNTPSGQSKISAQARGRLLLDFLESNSLLILNERFQKPSDSIPYTTKYYTIVDYFIVPKTLLHDVTHCTAYPDSWKNIPATITTAPANHVRKEKTTDHNLLSLKLLLPSQPHTHQSYKQDIQMPPAPRTSYSAHKLKHDTVKKKHTARIWKKQPEKVCNPSNISSTVTTLTTSARRDVLTKHAT